MSDPNQYFALEDNLDGLYECLDSIQKEFLNLREKARHRKRMRPVSDYHATFVNNIYALRRKLTFNLNGIFNMLSDLSTYDKIVIDILKSLRTARIRYKIDNEDYGTVIRSITLCVVSLIMDDEELNKQGAEIRSRRTYFLDKFLTLDLTVLNPFDENDDGEIDVTSVPQAGAQIPTSATHDGSGGGAFFGGMQSASQVCKLESIYVLDVLFDALTRHTSYISDISVKEANLRIHIFHIGNITHIVEGLLKYLKTLRQQIQAAKSSSQFPLDSRVLNQMKIAMGKYEESLANNLDKLGPNHRLGSFRRDLRKVLFQVRLILPWLK